MRFGPPFQLLRASLPRRRIPDRSQLPQKVNKGVVSERDQPISHPLNLYLYLFDFISISSPQSPTSRTNTQHQPPPLLASGVQRWRLYNHDRSSPGALRGSSDSSRRIFSNRHHPANALRDFHMMKAFFSASASSAYIRTPQTTS